MLSSDEDDLEEMNNDYLENLARMALKNSEAQGVNMTAKIEDYDESDDVSIFSVELLAVTCSRVEFVPCLSLLGWIFLYFLSTFKAVMG